MNKRQVDYKNLARKIIEYYDKVLNTSVEGIEEENYQKNLEIELNKGNIEFYQHVIDTILKADEQFDERSLTPEESKLVDLCNDIVLDLVILKKQVENEKTLGELTKEELKKLSSTELAEKMTEQLESIQFDVASERQEFFKFLSGFNSYNYTYRNCMLLRAQAEERGLMPVFATMKEWNKKHTSIKSGQRALLLCTPQKYNVYFGKNWIRLPH